MGNGQLAIDFDYDQRTVNLSTEIGIILIPHLPPGTKNDLVKLLSTRIALLAAKRFKDQYEPQDPIRCHTCDEMTLPKNRVRVVVCPRCSFEGRAVGSTG